MNQAPLIAFIGRHTNNDSTVELSRVIGDEISFVVTLSTQTEGTIKTWVYSDFEEAVRNYCQTIAYELSFYIGRDIKL